MMVQKNEIDKMVEEGYTYYEKKQYIEAIKIFNYILNSFPYDERAFVGKCASLRLLGRFEEATNLLKNARKKDPENVRILNLIGWLCFDQKRYERAYKIFDLILSIDPQNKNAQKGRRLSDKRKLKQKNEELFENIKLYRREKQYEKELDAINQILIKDIKNKSIILRKIELLKLLRRFDEAHEITDDALNKYPKTTSLLNLRGWLYIDQKKYDEAIKIFDITIKNRGGADEFEGKIESLREMGKFEEARRIVTYALDKYPENIRLLNQLGRLYFDQKKYEKAIDIFDRIINHNSKGFSQNCYLGFLGKISSLREIGRYKDADKLVKHAVRIFPENVRVLNQWGRLYFSQNKYKKAVDVFDHVLSLEPYSENAFLGKIASLREMDMFEDAHDLVKYAIKIFPQSTVVLNQWGWLCYDQKRYEEAIEIFDKSLNIGPYNEYAFIGKIASLRLSRQFDEAERVVFDALDKYPQNVEVLNQLGRSYFDQKKYEKAIEIFNQMLEIDLVSKSAFVGKIASFRELWMFDEATTIIDKLQQNWLDDVEILNQRAGLLAAQSQYDGAIKIFNDILSVDPDNGYALTGKSFSLRKSHQLRETEVLLRNAIKKYPKNGRIINQLAWLQFDQDLLDDADTSFLEAIRLNPYKIQLKFNRVRVLNRMGREYVARNILLDLKRDHPDDLDVIEQLGKFYLRQNEFILAENEFNYILSKDCTNISAINGLGNVYLNQGNYYDAENKFQEALKARPSVPTSYVNLARVLIIQGVDVYEKAEEYCKKALRLDPYNADALGCLGAIEYGRDNITASEGYLLQSIYVDPLNGKYADLGALYVQMGKYELAEENLRQAIKFNQYDSQAHISLGNLYLQTERSKEAIREFRQAIVANQNNENAPRALAIALMQAGDYNEAEKVLRSSIRRLSGPKTWRLHLKLARLLTHLGDNIDGDMFKINKDNLYEEALKEASKSIRIRPKEPEIHFYKGIILFKLGKKKEALKSFKTCLEYDESNFEAERNVNIIKSLISDDKYSKLKMTYLSSVVISVNSLLVLIFMWYNFFYSDAGKVSPTMLIVLSPILLGLILIACILPSLIRLRLPGGIEAHINPPHEPTPPPEPISMQATVTVGFGSTSWPASDIGFGSPMPPSRKGPF